MEGDYGTAIDVAADAIKEDKDKVGWGCLLLVLVLVAMAVAGGTALLLEADPACAATRACVDTVTNGEGAGSSQPREVTPQDGSSAGTGSEQQLPHAAAASAVPPGQGTAEGGNSLNPQAPSSTPTTASHQPEPTPAPAPAPPPPPPCDTQDPHSPCYEPPCDPSDPDSPCYEPPPDPLPCDHNHPDYPHC